LARLFWNQTCSRRKTVAHLLFRQFRLLQEPTWMFSIGRAKCRFSLSFCDAYKITSMSNFIPKMYLDYALKNSIAVYKSARCRNTQNHNHEILILKHEREITLGELGKNMISFKLILDKCQRI
jgi:hypothetical protein